MQPHPLFPFISTVIFCLSEMEIGDLSKLSLCLVISTSTDLSEAKMEEFMLPPPHIFFRKELQGKDLCTPPRPLFWAMFLPALKFCYFLKAFKLLDMIALNFAVRRRRNLILPMWTGQHWIGIHVFSASQERGYLAIHLFSKYISTGSQVSCRW